MEYIFLFIVILMCAFQNVAKKEYSKRTNRPNVYFFSAVISIFAILFFMVSAKFNLHFTKEVLVYSIFFGLAFASAQIGMFLAIKWGALSITMLISSFSLIIPTLHGIVFLREPVGVMEISGLILLVASLFLIYNKKEKLVFSFKWFISVIFMFAGNGFCSLVQKLQQMEFNGGYKSEFMVMGLMVCLLINVIMILVNKERITYKIGLSTSIGALSGLANGFVNMFVMVLTATIPSSILYPSISAGGIVLGYIVSRYYYKEILTKVQNMGYLTGMVSVIILNI